MLSFPYRNRFKFPFLSDSFLKTELYVHRPAPKRRSENAGDRQTNKHTDRSGLILSSSGVVFWTAKSQIPVADASKRCPENNTPNSLRNPVNGHLRLASVVALSSSGACGAIILYQIRVDHFSNFMLVQIHVSRSQLVYYRSAT